MKAIIIILLILWLLLSVAGAVIEGLLWLTLIGVILVVATAAYGWFKLRRSIDRS